MKPNPPIRPATGKLGVLLPGLGAVATTFIAGVLNIRKGRAKAIGSLTQLGTIRLGKRSDDNVPTIREFVPLAGLDDLVFGAWDIFEASALESAINAGVLEARDIEPIREELAGIKPMSAVFEQKWVKNLAPQQFKKGTKREQAEQLREDIRRFKRDNGLDRAVAVWCASTEVYEEPGPVHATLAEFERGLDRSHPDITPSQIYAWACLMEDVAYANGAPNLSCEIGAIQQLAIERNVPVSGKDFKTGQTFLKTVLAPAFKARMLGIDGWYSTNILGNRDGLVLDDPGSFKSKEVSKLGVLEQILQPDKYPDLYGDLHHVVRINYYRPRGDNKEGWDNIDIKGWLGYPMQIKVNFLCRDSILAAPIVLDLALFMDFAHRAGLRGTQEWLSFYFKSPMHEPEVYAENDLFIQLTKLKNTLRFVLGEDPITHVGHEYYPLMSEALTNAFRQVAVPFGRGLGALGVSPNAVTLATLVLHLVVAVLYVAGGLGTVAFGVAVLGLGFLDVVDGAIARQTGQVTVFGGFLDAWVDRLADSSLLVGLLVAWHAQGDVIGVVGAAVALAAFPQVAYTRAKAETLGIDCRVGLLNRTVRVLVLGVGLIAGVGVPVVWALGIGSLWTASHRALHVRRALALRVEPKPRGG